MRRGHTIAGGVDSGTESSGGPGETGSAGGSLTNSSDASDSSRYSTSDETFVVERSTVVDLSSARVSTVLEKWR